MYSFIVVYILMLKLDMYCACTVFYIGLFSAHFFNFGYREKVKDIVSL